MNGITNAINATMTRTNSYTAGSKASFLFNGSRITRIYSMDPTRASENIYIDGTYVGTLSSNAPETRRQVAATWAVSPGDHTIEVRGTGGGYVDIDAFAVDIATVGAGSYDDYDGQFRYFGNWLALSPQPCE